MEFDPITFGITIGRIIESYGALVRDWAAPAAHLAIVVILYLIGRFGNRYRSAFVLFFLIDYAWLFGWVGVYAAWQLFRQAGPVYLGAYFATPVLLAVIAVLLFMEWKKPRLNFDFQAVPAWRLAVAVPFLAWAFFYPNWRFDGAGFDWNLSQLVTGNFGLMGCPVTMFMLGVLFLQPGYANTHLYRVLTLYAILLGGAMVAVGYRTDIPFLVLGIVSLGNILAMGSNRKNATGPDLSIPA